MTKTKEAAPDIVIGDATVRSEQGLNPLLARRVRDALQGLACTATLYNGRGASADARNLLELLLLGAHAGERLAVRCAGRDAHAAYSAVIGALEAGGGRA